LGIANTTVATQQISSWYSTIGLDKLLAIETKSSRIKIALFDGMPDLENPENSNVKVENTHLSSSNLPIEHTTHLASLFVGKTVGISKNCELSCYPVLRNTPGGMLESDEETISKAIDQAVINGANVLNFSMGSTASYEKTDSLINISLHHAHRQGCLLIASVGNEGCDEDKSIFDCRRYPAQSPLTLAVGACDRSGKMLGLTNYSSAYQGRFVLAPGENIMGATVGGGFTSLTGTSFSCAIVSACVALLWSHFPSKSAHEIRSAVLQGAGAVLSEENSANSNVVNIWNSYLILNESSHNTTEEQTMETSSILDKRVPAEMALQVNQHGCGCKSCSAKEEKPLPVVESTKEFVLPIGILEVEFQSESDKRRWIEEYGLNDPYDMKQIGKILLGGGTPPPPIDEEGDPETLAAASDLKWYIRIGAQRRYRLFPGHSWVNKKYRRLARILSGLSTVPPIWPATVNASVSPEESPGVLVTNPTLRWTAVPGATRYLLEYDINASGVFTQVYVNTASYAFQSAIANSATVDWQVTAESDYYDAALGRINNATALWTLPLQTFTVGTTTGNSSIFVFTGDDPRDTRLLVIAARALMREPGYPEIIVADPFLEGVYEFTVNEVLDAAGILSPEDRIYLGDELLNLIRDFSTPGDTDQGRAINAAISRSLIALIHYILLRNAPSVRSIHLSAIEASPIATNAPNESIWSINISFRDDENSLRNVRDSKIVLDLTSAIPTVFNSAF
jgi:hypothetical protein